MPYCSLSKAVNRFQSVNDLRDIKEEFELHFIVEFREKSVTPTNQQLFYYYR